MIAKKEEPKKLKSKEFSQEVEILAARSGITFLDALDHCCTSNNIDHAAVGPLITKNLKEKIAKEAEQLNLIPKTSRLPLQK